jgi:hypothetical protein
MAAFDVSCSEERLHNLLRLFGWHDGYDLAFKEVIPAQDPLLEQTSVVALHELKTTAHTGFDPAADVRQSVGQAASLIPEAAVNRRYGAWFEPFDDHEQHRRLLGLGGRLGRMIADSSPSRWRR